MPRKKPEVKITVEKWLTAFNCQCWYCAGVLTVDATTVDHRVPTSRGGTEAVENLVPSCYQCNRMKNNRTEAEFYRSRPAFNRERTFPQLLIALGSARLSLQAVQNRPQANGKLNTQLEGQYLLWPDCRDCGGSGWQVVRRSDGLGQWAVRCDCRKAEPKRFKTEYERDREAAKRYQSGPKIPVAAAFMVVELAAQKRMP